MSNRWPLSLPGLEPVRLLGSGGFGQVWLADQTDLDRQVAVKVSHRPPATDDERRRFMRECKALGRLSGHPHVVEVHTSGIDNGLPYLVMAYLDGGTLEERGPDLGEAGLRQVTADLCDAVEAAHELGILHRDLKPANVFLDGGGRAVLGDFGIARLRDADHTTGDGITASMAYVAPELLAGDAPSTAADVYGIGITVISAALGHSPFVSPGGPIEAVLGRIRDGDLPDLTNHGISAPFAQLLQWACQVDPAQRPTSARELGRAVAQLDKVGDVDRPSPIGDDHTGEAVAPPPAPSWDVGRQPGARQDNLGATPHTVVAALPTPSGGPSASTESALSRYFASPKNILGMGLAGVGVLLVVLGVIGPGWPLIVAGLYGFGALVGPLSSQQRQVRDRRRAEAEARTSLQTAVVQVRSARTPSEVEDLIATIEELAVGVLPAIPDHAVAVTHSITRLLTGYLPDTVGNYLAITHDQRSVPGPDGRSPDQLVITQLGLLREELEQLTREANAGHIEELERHGQFLQARFSDPLEW